MRKVFGAMSLQDEINTRNKSDSLPSAKELMSISELKALDMMFSIVDDLLYAGHDMQSWPELENWSIENHPDELSTTLIVGFLTITLPISKQGWRINWALKAVESLDNREPNHRERGLLNNSV